VARRIAMAAAAAVGSLPELGWQVRVVGEAAGDIAQLQPRWIEPQYYDGGVRGWWKCNGSTAVVVSASACKRERERAERER
jgi:hypothetical protein